MPGHFNAVCGFFLKGMKDPKVVTELYGINRAECISAKLQRDFKNTGTDTFHRLRDIGFATVGSDRQCIDYPVARALRKCAQFLFAADTQEMGRVSFGDLLLLDVGKFTNTCQACRPWHDGLGSGR